MNTPTRVSAILLAAAFLCAGTSPAAGPDPVIDHPAELVVLVHGFGRTGHNMRFLKDYFEERGYAVVAPTLPTLFRSVDACADILARKLEECDTGRFDRVHLVGHSMGGLIIRQYLAENTVANLGRCVLIGSPNDGTPLGAIARTYLPPLTWISPAYKSFQPGGMPIPAPLNSPAPDFGAIAGNGDGLLLGRLMEAPNDGRVPVDSVPFAGMTDFTILPYHHDQLHFRRETAEIVERFLVEGEF